MGTWGSGNFDCDGALDFLSEIVEEFIETVEDCFADDGSIALDEGGEAILMPSVEVMAVLCEHCQATPPDPAIVAEWRSQYLAAFDAQIDGLDPAPGFKAERRQVIEQTFARLETQAHQFWDS